MKLFNLFITSTILVSGLSAVELKRSMKVVPLSSIYLSTENGGTNHASAALSDGVGIYTTQEDEYARAISYLNGKYGDDALKDKKSLKEYVLDNGTVADKELAEKLNLATAQKSNIGDSCDDLNPETENDIYQDTNFTCKGEPISKSIECKGKPIGSEFKFGGKTYLVVNNTTIKRNLNRADTLCTSNVTNMADLFSGNSSFNQNISNWDTSNVTDMSYIFWRATSFDQPIGDWDTSKVTNMSYMLSRAEKFNQPLNWNTSNVKIMDRLFESAKLFNQPLNWNTSKVTSMSSMFYGTSFNQPIGKWDTSSVTNMNSMFYTATKFNQPIGDWDTSKVTNMGSMFTAAINFNQPLNFKTSKVTNMQWMFRDASSFNQPLNFDTSSVTNMNMMFYYASSFNKPLNFDTSSVKNMGLMFYYASSFNQDISSWNTSNVTDYTGFAIGSLLTSANAPYKDGTKFETTQP